MVVDEPRNTSQVSAMYGGDQPKRKFGRIWFPTSAAMDNRPLKFDEFEAMPK
jgi:excinuclease ABC subunit B